MAQAVFGESKRPFANYLESFPPPLATWADILKIDYDPILIRYEDLLNTFWAIHDPTSLNRQGPDRGEQYRSVIFYHSPAQATAARKAKFDLEQSRRYEKPIVTAIEPASKYWLAEEYHQQYFEKKSRLN